MAVSKALLIIGMLVPKPWADVFGTALTGLAGLSGDRLPLLLLLLLLLPGATSVARSHEPSSWERATEKNRST